MPGSSGMSGKEMLAMLAISGAANGISGVLEGRANRKQQDKMTAAEIAARKALADQEVASRESLANPFRHQLDQGATAGKLDRMERATYSPVHIAPPPGPYAKYATPLTETGGYSYEKSPEFVNAARSLKNDVIAGHTAPSMTDPANYGRTGAMALDANGNPTGRAAGPAGAGQATMSVDDFTASYDRRGGGTGGAASGAARGALTGASAGSIVPGVGTVAGGAFGLVAGGIAGAIHKHASTAPTDFTVADARTAIDRAISYYQGRKASPQEIEQMLAGQGLKPGDRWVGEGGLMAVINAIARSGSAA